MNEMQADKPNSRPAKGSRRVNDMDRWPQLNVGAEITHIRLVHDTARVEFPEINIIESDSYDGRVASTLFGPQGGKGISLCDECMDFTVLFRETGTRFIPVRFTDRAQFSLYYDRDGIPYRTMFNAEISNVSAVAHGEGDDSWEEVDDALISVSFKLIWLCGRAPIGDGFVDSVITIEKMEQRPELAQIAKAIEAKASDLRSIAEQIRDRL